MIDSTAKDRHLFDFDEDFWATLTKLILQRDKAQNAIILQLINPMSLECK